MRQQKLIHKKPSSRSLAVVALIIIMVSFGIFGLHVLFPSYATTPQPGDVNGDGKVDTADLLIMANHWGITSGATLSQGDLNGDGKVSVTDLAILASSWGNTSGSQSAPATSADTGALICNNGPNASVLTGPSTAPAGAVTIAAGSNDNFSPSPNKTYYFASGVHTLGNGIYSQIIPADNDSFIGAPGAIIDGQHLNAFAFTQHATGVTIKYLTIRNFKGSSDQFIVNHDSGYSWNISNNTIGPNDLGAALGLGNNEQVTYNCLTQNGQYGINGYNANTSGGPTPGVVIDHNEFDTNDAANYDQPQFPGDPEDCGCAGGIKLWADVGTKVTNNYIHDNHDPGLWADTLNVGVDVENNYISGNWGEGVFYEVSYNARINNNTFVNNGWVKGSQGGTAPAIYISESGWDSRVDGGSGFTSQEIAGNVFTNNWDGIVLWENSNRYCSNGSPTDQCTLVDPAVYTSWPGKDQGNGGTCAYLTTQVVPAPDPSAGKQGVEPTYNCRWRTQNNNVHNNTFNFDPTAIHGPAGSLPCTLANACGLNAIMSNFSSTNFWPADTIPDQIALNQNNVFDYNTYTGPWKFETDAQTSHANLLEPFSYWQVRHTDSGSEQKNAAQDIHSTCTGCQ